jgi:cytochrome c peroxidase
MRGLGVPGKPVRGALTVACRLMGRLVVVLILTMAATAKPASATIVLDTPWNPIAAAYRTAMFMADLAPPDWIAIARTYAAPLPMTTSPRAARAHLLALGLEAEMSGINQAIEAQDRAALYAATTRATARALRRHLAAAREALGTPGAAHARALEAQALYRAFADMVAQADPDNAARVGRAWLTLITSAGSPGVAGAGRIAADRARFAAAAETIEAYIAENYDVAEFAPRARSNPLPDTAVRARGEVAVIPWLPPGTDLRQQDPLPRLVLNFEERGIEETDLPLVAYGDMLFDSPEIFGPMARQLGIACSTCHNRSDINQRFFIPGISHQPGAADVSGGYFNPAFNNRRADSLDIPSLRGLRFTGPYGRDGRFASLRDFTRNVIVNEFAGPEPTPFILDALEAYLLEFDFLPNSKVDPQGRLTATASAAARRGETIFNTPFRGMGGQSCASCHMPTANFMDRRQHNIGSARDSYRNARDGAFDTPTLLGARFTAPYFHDGSLPTLASVVDWFNRRFSLGLDRQQRSDLTAYLEAVGDADEPYHPFEGRETPFRLAFEELTTFASTLDLLIPRQDRFHADLMLRTVAADLRADAAGMNNRAAMGKVHELADQLVRIRESILADDWSGAATRWAAFRRSQEDYDADMY